MHGTMKLRIKGNSVRFRLMRSEVKAFLETGRIEEHVQLGPKQQDSLTYAIEYAASATEASVKYEAQEFCVVLPQDVVQEWGNREQVGIYDAVPVFGGSLTILIEKDFACLDRSDAENADTYPNPNVTC